MKKSGHWSRANLATLIAVAVFAVVALVATGCGGGKSNGSSSSSSPKTSDSILGAGSSFAFPIFSKWASEYASVAGVKLNYQSIGSGGGIAAIEAKTVDFGASDAPLQQADLTANHLVQFPVIVGGVVPVINVKGIAQGALKLNADVLAKIYSDKIKTWDDAAIKALNPGLTLPSTAIAVIHRSDASGTTWIFANYLTAAAPASWKLGADKSVNWPVGVGGKGNEGVAANVKQLNGAIGYVEYAYAKQNNMNWVQLQNKAGAFVEPSVAAFQAAAAEADWKNAAGFYLVLVDQPGAKTWPITGATFVLVQQAQANAAHAQVTLKFIDWALKNGVSTAQSLDYVPLPAGVVDLVEKSWTAITAGGTPVWPN
jgi:phosphate transport system substrate-binding protein